MWLSAHTHKYPRLQHREKQNWQLCFQEQTHWTDIIPYTLIVYKVAPLF